VQAPLQCLPASGFVYAGSQRQQMRDVFFFFHRDPISCRHDQIKEKEKAEKTESLPDFPNLYFSTMPLPAPRQTGAILLSACLLFCFAMCCVASSAD
jgi:hypothetical protein